MPIRTHPVTSSKSDAPEVLRGPTSVWVVHWIEAMMLVAGGAIIASVAGWADFTVNKVWQVSAIASGALSLGFGAAYLFDQLRRNTEAAALETEFEHVSARIDSLVSDYNHLERKVMREGERKSEIDS